MGNVRALRPAAAGPTTSHAVAAFLAMIHVEATRKAYAGTLNALAAHLEPDAPLAALEQRGDELAAWFTGRWGERAPSTWNRNLDALRSAVGWWTQQGWLTGDPTRALRRRRKPADRSKAIDRIHLDAFLRRPDLALRERTLYRMLYETAARSAEVLALDVDGLDLANRRAKVRRKGGAMDVITWQTGTARLLPRLIAGRQHGPLFVTDRRARVALPPSDLDPEGRARLSYRRAEEMFKSATRGEPAGPWKLHQLRHSAITHATEDGANTGMLMALSGHTSTASLAQYGRVSPEALGRWQGERDPARRTR